MALAHSHAVQRQPAAASQSASIRSPSPPTPVSPQTIVAPTPPPADSAPAAHANGPAGLSKAPPSPEKVQAATEKFLAAVKDKVRSRSVFTRPNIVKYKLVNALAAFAPGVDRADALALVDSTMFGSAKEGLLVTSSALYSKDPGTEPRQIAIQDVQEIKFTSGMFVAKLRINDVDFFHLASGEKGMPAFAEALATFCRDINS
jgi:hypothetical protein